MRQNARLCKWGDRWAFVALTPSIVGLQWVICFPFETAGCRFMFIDQDEFDEMVSTVYTDDEMSP